jgi:hypothetical protein
LDWTQAEHRSGKFLKKLDSDELYDQLNTIGSYLNQLRAAFGKMAKRQWGPARDRAINAVHDTEGAMRDNIAASLIVAIGLGVALGYLIGRSSD